MTNAASVSVIGLGAMGTTLVNLLAKSGRRVTVYNRTAAKAAPFGERGVAVAADVATAFAASDTILVCVSNDAAASDVFSPPHVNAAVRGRAVIQLTTLSPTSSRDGADWAHQHGAKYLVGAIQAAPSQMGAADTPLLVSGDVLAWESERELLRTLAGGSIYLGADAGAAPTMDLATLSWVYGAFLGFLQGALLARAEGLDVARYGSIVRAISPSFGAFFEHEGAVIESRSFAISESPLRISVDATARLLQMSLRAGVNAELPRWTARLFQQAAEVGLGDSEVAALIQVLSARGEGAPGPIA